jgi:hypothetical protein
MSSGFGSSTNAGLLLRLVCHAIHVPSLQVLEFVGADIIFTSQAKKI